MAQDWLADVRKYASDADEKVVAAIVRHCGVALRNPDSALVAFSDANETARVRKNYLKKKLGLTHDDATLDAGIAAVGERMKADRTKNRVTVYYLLADHFGGLAIFGGVAGVAAASAVLGGSAVGLAAIAAGNAVAEPVAPRPSSGGGGGASSPSPGIGGESRGGGDDEFFGWGCFVALLVLGAILLAALLAWAAARKEPVPAADPVAVAAPVVPAPQAAPQGAGVIASEREARPMLTVYFDTGKAEVTPDFAAAAGPLLAYLEANPAATLAISGFNDPTGNAAANAELSKNRAQNVKAALERLGVAADRALLEKPTETTGTGATDTESRRVEVVIKV